MLSETNFVDNKQFFSWFILKYYWHDYCLYAIYIMAKFTDYSLELIKVSNHKQTYACCATQPCLT